METSLKVLGGERAGGPEVPTLFERAVNRLHIPYSIACGLLALTLGFVSSNFAESSLSWVLWTLLAFYMLYAIRYLRLKVVSAESQLLPLCPQGEETFHSAFGSLSRNKPQILFIAAMVPVTTFYFSRLLRFTGPLHLTLTIATLVLFSAAWGTVFWLYSGSIRGLHKLGKEPLKLKPYHEDVTLGLRPLGSLSLQLTFVYLSIIGLGSLATSFFADVFNIASLGIFAGLGTVLFFWPLSNIHRVMTEEKCREQESIRSRLTSASEAHPPFASEGQSPTLSDLGDFLAELKGLLALDIAERRLGSVPTWPFDNKILRQLTLILVSVMGVIIGRIVIVALHL